VTSYWAIRGRIGIDDRLIGTGTWITQDDECRHYERVAVLNGYGWVPYPSAVPVHRAVPCVDPGLGGVDLDWEVTSPDGWRTPKLKNSESSRHFAVQAPNKADW